MSAPAPDSLPGGEEGEVKVREKKFKVRRNPACALQSTSLLKQTSKQTVEADFI